MTEPVLIILDRAIPAGPWDARIVLRSGTTEREATAKITFPAVPAASSGAVEVDADSPGGSSLPLVIGGAVALVGACALASMTIRRRRLRRAAPPSS